MARSKVFSQINKDNITQKKYTAHKTWVFSDTSSGSVTAGRMLSPFLPEYPGGKIPLGSVPFTYNDDGTIPYTVYHGYRHFRKSQHLDDFLDGVSGSYLQIPQNLIGDGIKKNTLVITDYSYKGNQITLKDNEGLLYDIAISTSSLMPETYLQYYLSANLTSSYSEIVQDNVSEGSKVHAGGEECGVLYKFDNSYIKIPHNSKVNFNTQHDYTISFIVDLPSNQKGSSNFVTLVSKRTQDQPDYPFSIKLGDNIFTNKIVFQVASGISSVFLTSSALPPGQHHIACYKSGSKIGLFVDQVEESSTTIDLYKFGYISNTSDVYIGSKDVNYNESFSGSLGEIRIYNTGPDLNQLKTLGGLDSVNWGFLQNPAVGVVDYSGGVIYVSSINSKFKNIFLGDGEKNYGTGSFSVTFKNIHPVYEYKVKCEVNGGFGNVSMNPTFLTSPEVSSSLYTPYVTSVGLYDDNYNLLAVGKLSTPLKKEPQVNFNIQVQIDL